jgi:hypothetical protein
LNDESDKPEKPEKPEPQWAPDEQALLPGMRPVLGFKPRDYRQWSDGRGNKIDAPRYGGRSSGGKTVVPLVGSDGRPITLGTFQIVRNARGGHSVVDWSKPMFEEPDAQDDVGESVSESRIMGREVFKPHQDLRRAMAAMIVLHRDAEAKKAGLPVDPAQVIDDRGKEIRRGSVALCRYARGPAAGRFAVVDHAFSPRRVFDLEDKTTRAALKTFEKEAARRVSKKPRPAVRGAPIAFEVPSGFGRGTFRQSWGDKTYPEPGGICWMTCVMRYAETGKWCQTANLIWADLRPSELEQEAREAREAFLLSVSRSSEVSKKDATAALDRMKKLGTKEKTVLNQILEAFDAVLVEIT